MRMFALIAAGVGAISAVAFAAGHRDGWTSSQNNDEPMIVGNGQVIRQVRPISGIDAVELAGSSDVVVTVGPTASLTIEAESNILPLLTSETHGSTLKIGSRGSYRTQHSPRYFLTLPRLAGFELSGSGNARLQGLSSDRLSLSIQGSGNIEASGRARSLSASIQGSGDMALRNLAVGDAEVSVQGSGNITVAATGRVAARSFGSGDIELVGQSASLDIQEGGSGSVRTASR